MGTFVGHLVPGCFFALYGLWLGLSVLHRHMLSLYEPRRRPFANSATIPTGRLPLEAALKLLSAVVGVIGEYLTALDDQGRFVHVGNAQHMTMFTFFGISGVFDLLYFCKVPGMPAKLDYWVTLLAFAVEGLLFYWHLHGRTHMDVQVHTFLLYLIMLVVVSLLVEMARPRDARAGLARAYFIFMQGLWFIEVGQILYPVFGRPWDTSDHEQMMLVTILFAWNFGLALFVFLLLAGLTYRRAKHKFCGAPPPPAAPLAAEPGSAKAGGAFKPKSAKAGAYKTLPQNDIGMLELRMSDSDDEEFASLN